MTYIEQEVKFPEIDLRERLSLSRGYSVVEMPVVVGSGLVDKAISATQLSELEINVLSITRDSVTIPVPRPSETLRSGDTLLCYGKQETLKMLLPETRKKRKNRKMKPLAESTILEAQNAAKIPHTEKASTAVHNKGPGELA